MFTGLIEEVGKLGSLRIAPAGLRLGVLCPSLAPALSVGESIAVDGVCLTVTSRGRDAFEAEAVGDTLEKTTLQGMRRGRRVNLERSLAAGGRLDGHIVMGHVTGRARIRSWGPASSSAAKAGADDPAAWFLIIDLDPSWADRIAVEGSIAVDGISLTVAGLEGIESLTGPPESARFAARISVIPHTRLATGLASKKIGDEVNVELDVLASYVRTAVAALLRSGSVNETSAPGGPRLDIERLKSWGYR
jgi:riboflavin synthase